MSRSSLLFAMLLSSLAVSSAQAAPQVQVVGLFPGAAVLSIDGERKLVKVGQTGPEGVTVVSADSHGAVLRVDGHERNYELGREYSDGFAKPAKTQFSIALGHGGHYWPQGSINGNPVQFLVDTGATTVALSEEDAARIGIDYRLNGVPMIVSTANGQAKAWKVTLDRVKLGDIEVIGVEGTVVQGGGLPEILLGMSFLNRIRWRDEQGVLIMESKT